MLSCVAASCVAASIPSGSLASEQTCLPCGSFPNVRASLVLSSVSLPFRFPAVGNPHSILYLFKLLGTKPQNLAILHRSSSGFKSPSAASEASRVRHCVEGMFFRI